MNLIRVLIADDHEIFRNGLKLLFNKASEIVLCGEAENGRHLLLLVAEVVPDVVIMDIQMPEMDGVAACREIRESYPHISVIALTTFNDNHHIVDMLQAGATGYLLKNTSRQELQKAIRNVHQGGMYFSPDTAKKFQRLRSERRLLPGRITPAIKFNEKELKVLELICRQQTSKEIAAAVGVSVRTIESYRKRMQEKIDAKNMAGLVLYAVQHNLFDL